MVERLLRLGPWALIALTAAAYTGVAGAGFVWDDPQVVFGNPALGTWAGTLALFVTDVWHSAGIDGPPAPYFRPLFVVSISLDRWLWGDETVGYHLQSLLWHLIAVGACFGWMRGLVGVPRALLGATLFALHPMQTEAVVWISGRMDPIAAVFSLGTLWAFQGEAGLGRRTLGVLLFFCALLSKEMSVLVPALVVLQGWAERRPLRAVVLRAAPLLLAYLPWWWLRATAGADGGSALGARLDRVLADLPTILGIYGRLFVVPWPLSMGRRVGDLHEAWAHTALGLTALFGLVALVGARGGRLGLLSVTAAAAFFVPTLLGMAATAVVGERYTYLPIAALGLGIAALIRETWAPRIAALLALPYVVAVGVRVPAWTDNLSLTGSAAVATPSGSSFAHHADAQLRASNVVEALVWTARSLRADPPSTRLCVGGLRLAADHGRGALEDMLAAASSCPRTAEQAIEVAKANVRLGHFDDARPLLEQLARDAQAPQGWEAAAAALAVFDQDVGRYRALVGDDARKTEVALLLDWTPLRVPSDW